MADYDLAVIGGGINGVGIARDAAGRGLRVLLVEQSDLASATSSASSKLIHGGLRYLEHGAFRLVRESLIEREVLLRLAPHLIRPLRFVLPHHAGLRPAWMLRLGLFIYDHLGGRKLLPPTRTLDLRSDPAGAPLKEARRGFEYSDCWVDDSRLVILNAVDAAERGATIRTRTRCVKAERHRGGWRLRLATRSGAALASAAALVNATGPWVAQASHEIFERKMAAPVRLVKGSHIVVPRLYAHDRAYTFQHADGRVVFAIPYEGRFTMIGTTDRDYDGDPAQPRPSDEEIAYLCGVASAYFRAPVSPADVVWSFAGVRPLYDDGASKAKDATRDYVLALDAPDGEPPLLTVYGGKITTYRRLAEAAMEHLAPFFAPSRPWTRTQPLPGGDLPWDGMAALTAQTRARWPFLREEDAGRMAHAYGTRVERVLGDATSPAQLGPTVDGLSRAEIRYLAEHEWAQDADDILWRRSKLGLRIKPDQLREVMPADAATPAPAL